MSYLLKSNDLQGKGITYLFFLPFSEAQRQMGKKDPRL